jgi:hypothetical protein
LPAANRILAKGNYVSSVARSQTDEIFFYCIVYFTPQTYLMRSSLSFASVIAIAFSAGFFSNCSKSVESDETRDSVAVTDTPFDTLFTFCNWTELGLRETPSEKGKYLTTIYLGEQLLVTGDTASEAGKNRLTKFHKVKLADGKMGWVQDDLIAIDAARGVFVNDANVRLRPDESSVTDKSFHTLDVVAVRPSTGIWVEVIGKPAGGTWLQKGYVHIADLSFKSVDVDLCALYRRAMEVKDPQLQVTRLEQLKKVGLESSSLYAIIFPPQGVAGENSDSDEFTSYTFDKTLDELRGGQPLEDHGVTWVADVNGLPESAAHFEGRSGRVSGEMKEDHLDVTYCMWLKADKVQPGMIPIMIGNACTSGYGINLEDDGAGGMRVTVLCGGVLANATNSQYTLPVNEWVHLALVKQGNTFSIFVNGVLSSTDTTNYNALNGQFTVGAATACNGNDYGAFFAGAIDDLYIAYKALSAEEIAPIMHSGD